MATVLTNLHVLTCPHMGTVKKTLAPKLVVQTQQVLTNVGPVITATCQTPVPPATNVKCSTVTITAGKATKLKVGGAAVLLSTLAATAAGTPGGSLVFAPPGPAVPTKLSAV